MLPAIVMPFFGGVCKLRKLSAMIVLLLANRGWAAVRSSDQGLYGWWSVLVPYRIFC